uniref:Uncharacterized protein n=1 Tax=Clastoptera arizonana TaxID=38151 RepID=A0A1B6CZL8_9HEMI
MAKTRTGKIATGLAVGGFFFVLLAFTTPSWLVTDGLLEKPKFEQLGLWLVCFHDLEDPRHWYDTKFSGCWWVFLEEYYIIHDLLLPGFFVAVQFFYTLSFVATLLSFFLVLGYLCASRENEHFVLLQLIVGGLLLGGAVTGTFAVYIFGANGDGRVWMPNWEHNNMGYSYVCAVLGVIMEYIAGCLYIIQARYFDMKKKKNYESRQGQGYDYHMEERKSTSHTTI